MTPTLLILILSTADAAPVEIRAGVMATPELCQITGRLLAAEVTRQVPDLSIGWTCTAALPGVQA